jgi:hypothetical protein
MPDILRVAARLSERMIALHPHVETCGYANMKTHQNPARKIDSLSQRG